MKRAELERLCDLAQSPDAHFGLADRGLLAHACRVLLARVDSLMEGWQRDSALILDLTARERSAREQLRIVLRQNEEMERELEARA